MRNSSQRTSSRLLFVTAFLGLALLAGCGNSSTPGTTPSPAPGASTNVVVLFTSTANDKLAEFTLEITGITLTDNAGNTVPLFHRMSMPNGVTGNTEFTGLNGAFTPVATASVPQGTYTSATLTTGQCWFTTITIPGGSLNTSTDEEGTCGQGTGNTTVNLPAPITVSGSGMALSFNLQIPQSYTVTPSNVYTISPVFALTTAPISSRMTGILARFGSVNADGNSFVANTPDGFSLTLASDANTQFQGIAGLTSLTPGMLFDLDAAIQSDGSLLARRVEVSNAAAMTADMLLPDFPSVPDGNFGAQPRNCFPDPIEGPACESVYFFDSSTRFHVSGQFSNLQSLPFAANFSSSTMVLGQNVLASSTGGRAAQSELIVNDFTLEPQTLNGTVTAVSTAGSFSIYTVALAQYDLFPVMQQLVQGPFGTIASPTTLVVYADSNTQLLQSGQITAGSLLRFRGLVFDDAGTLRMDCGQILDGVTE